MDITYGQSTEAEWEQSARLRADAFNRMKVDADFPRLAPELTIVARSGGTVVGTAAAIDFVQVINGAEIECAGVTGVAVPPQSAGQGIGKQLMIDVLHAAQERGQPLASLFPATSLLYRSMGFESAGVFNQNRITLEAVHRRPDEGYHVEVTDASAYDDPAIRQLHKDQVRRNNGWTHRPDLGWAHKKHQASNPIRPQRMLVGHGPEGPEAFAMIENTADTTVDFMMYDFEAFDLFGTPRGIRAIMASLTSQTTVAARVTTDLPIAELSAITPRPELAVSTEWSTWMERIIDLPAAMAARPVANLTTELHLDISDPVLVANAGHWVLRFDDGKCRAEPGGNGAISMQIADLASLYTGFASPHFLAASGSLPGATTQNLKDLATLFAAQSPTMLDHF